ncbi:hypothetical protein KP509_28G055800 [Ceratopteris richardii]|uniref:Pentatricopeptide repeat-containing protein n=2 Tax=Ceratopteris richardii TaxID=49495 RepID=A0A8T2RCA9_CERRI|nr:hypothetical protein KP509_28G055800 [Ceratopteris richardii]
MFRLCAKRSLLRGRGLVTKGIFSEYYSEFMALQLPINRCVWSSRAFGNHNYSWQEPFEEKADAPLGSERQWKMQDGIYHSTAGKAKLLVEQLSQLSAVANAACLLQQWFDDGNHLPKNIVIIVLTDLKRRRRFKHALEVADYIWNKKVYELNDTDHMYRLYFTGQVGTIEDVEKCVEGIPEECSTEVVYNQLISCYIARGMIAKAEITFEKLQQSRKLKSALIFGQFMSLYGGQGDYDKVFKLKEEMSSKDIQPDTRTCNILLNVIAKQGDLEQVLTLYNKMKDTAIPCDTYTHSVAIRAYMATGKEEKALELIEEMMNCRPEDRALANDLMLTVYADHGKKSELKRLWSRIQSSNKVSARTYGVMIESLGKLGLIEEAEDLASKAERKRGRLIARVFNALLNVYATHERMEAAEELMLRIMRERLRPSAVTYRHLVSGYLKIGELDKALEYLRTARESLTYDHSEPWASAFLLVLNHVAERGNVELAENLFESYTSAGPFRSVKVYNTLLKAYLNSNKTPKDFVQRMSDDGFAPNAETIALLKQDTLTKGALCQ